MLVWMQPPTGWGLGRLEWRPGTKIPDPLPYWGDRPWYLEDLPANMEQMFTFFGFATAYREALTPALARLFSVDACRRLVKTPWGRQALAGFYQTFIPYVLPLLELGADLMVAQPWSDTRLLGRLLQEGEHRGASVELAAWAALSQVGEPYTFEREPAGRDVSRPDFLVRSSTGGEWFVEVKGGTTSQADQRAADFESGLFSSISDLQAEHRAVTVEGTPLLRASILDEGRCKELSELQARAAEELESCAKDLRARGLPSGDYNVGDLLTVHVEEGDEAFVQFAVWDGLPPEKDAIRLVRLVRDAAMQVPEDSRAIVLLDVGAFKRLDVLSEELTRTLLSPPEAERFAPVRALVLFAYQRDPHGRLLRVPYQPELFGRVLSMEELVLCHRLARQSAALPA